MKKKAELIADYEAQIDALYRGFERKDAQVRTLEARIDVLRNELADLYMKLKELTMDTIEELKQ